jgi:hypothetical protein
MPEVLINGTAELMTPAARRQFLRGTAQAVGLLVCSPPLVFSLRSPSLRNPP